MHVFLNPVTYMSDCLILYLLDHKAYIAGAESTEIPDPDDEWRIKTFMWLGLQKLGISAQISYT